MTENELLTLPIEDGALTEAPVYETHKRGKNWLAVITVDPASPGGLHRAFQPRAHGEYYYLSAGLKPGQALEFGADYYSGGGKKHSSRGYYVIEEVADDHLTLSKQATGKAACQAARAWAEAHQAPDPRAALEAEREKLLARLAEIDAELARLEAN